MAKVKLVSLLGHQIKKLLTSLLLTQSNVSILNLRLFSLRQLFLGHHSPGLIIPRIDHLDFDFTRALGAAGIGSILDASFTCLSCVFYGSLQAEAL